MDEYFTVDHVRVTICGPLQDKIAYIVVHGRRAIGDYLAKNMLMTATDKRHVAAFLESKRDTIFISTNISKDLSYHTAEVRKLTARPEV